MEATPVQVFVRNDKGKVWGPLELPTVELLIDNGLIEGRLQVSQDGVNFAFPGRFPGIRDHFPRELWGDNPVGGAASQPASGRTIVLGSDPASAPAAAPARPVAAGVISAGPGARAAAAARAAPRVSQGPGAAPVVLPTGPGVIAPMPPEPAASAHPGAPRTPAPAPAPAASTPPPPPAAASDAAPAVEALPASGELSQISPLRLYYLAAVGEQNVEVTFKLPDREIKVHFRKGNPDFIDSDHPEDSLQAFLLKNGLATPDQIAQADANLDRFGGELIGALFGLGLLNAGSTFAQLAQRAQGLLLKVLSAEGGLFSTEARELPPHKVMPLGNKWAALTDCARRLGAADLRRRLQPVLELPIMKSGGQVAASELRLTPQETRALSYIDGVRSLAQLGADLPQELEHLLRVAFVLRELELVSFAATPAPRRPVAPAGSPPAAAGSGPKPAPAARPAPGPGATSPRPAAPAAGATAARPPAAASAATAARPPAAGATASRPAATTVPPAGPRPAGAAPAAGPGTRPAPVAASAKPAQPAAPVSHEDELKVLRARAAKLKDQNLFEVLELQQSADSSSVKMAYFKLARVYHPDTVTPDSPPEIAKLKGDIFAAVGDAYRRLGEDKSRAEYIEELKHGGGEQVDVQQILMAEEHFQRGCILVKARKFPEAVKMLDEAIKANDKEGEFYAWRAYAKYFAAPDKGAAKNDIWKDFNTALKLNERVGSLHYFMGHIAKLSGDNTGALKHFKKAIDYQPDHTDALRELRMMGTGKK